MFFLVILTYGSPAHPTRLHSHHNHRRRIEEGCTARYCIYTPRLYKGRAWGFDLGEDNKSAEEKMQHYYSNLVTVLTVFLFFIRAVTTVINRVAQLVAVDAAVIVTSETERGLTLDVH